MKRRKKVSSVVILALLLVAVLAFGALAVDPTAGSSVDGNSSSQVSVTTANPNNAVNTTPNSATAVTTPNSSSNPQGKAWGKRAATIREQIRVTEKEQQRLKKEQSKLAREQIKEMNKVALRNRLVNKQQLAAILKEVDHPKTLTQKKALAGAKVGVIDRIEAKDSKVIIYIKKADKSKVYDVYIAVNLDPSRTVVYDRTTRTQKTLADLATGDVVKFIPVKQASIMLVDKVGHINQTSSAPPAAATTTPDTLQTTTNPTASGTTPATSSTAATTPATATTGTSTAGN